ncbi:MAG: NFACT family protein [Chloroflexota bacterium]
MSPWLGFDAITLHAVSDELRAKVMGGLIQRVFLLGDDSFALEVYAQGRLQTLVVSIAADGARVHLARERASRATDSVTPMLLLLRKHVRDGRIVDIVQPHLERVIELIIQKRMDDTSVGRVALIIEAMGRRGNALLVAEDGTILDALRRATPAQNPVRTVLPHRRYVAPPAQDRPDPVRAETWEHLRDAADSQPRGAAVKLLLGSVAGMSPILANELVFRIAGSVTAANADVAWDQSAVAAQALLAPLGGTVGWRPCVAEREGQIEAYAPYELRHLAATHTIRELASISEAVDLAFAQGRVPRTARSEVGVSGALLRGVFERVHVVERRKAALERAAQRADDAATARLNGEWILATISQIPRGATAVSGPQGEIALDPLMTPSQNAQRYFEDYRKARDAGRRTPELIQRAERELAFLADMDVLIRSARDPGALKQIQSELIESGVIQADREQSAKRLSAKRMKQPAAPRTLTVPLDHGYVVLVGTSARSNERVTFDLAEQTDVWLHARQMPGAHVILRTGGRKPDDAALRRAAALAAYFSRGAEAGRVPVDFTLRKHVRKIRGGPPGLVTYVNEQTIDVRPEAPPAQRG